MGSAVSAIAWRMPLGVSWAAGRSRCPACGADLRVRDLVPLLSFLLLHGRCRHCGARISLLYPIIEIVCAVWTVLLFRHTDLVPSFPLIALWGYLLVALTVIDYRHQLLPDALTFPGLLLGIAAALAGGHSGWYAIQGIVAGAGFLWLLAAGYELVRKIEGMGGGDIKLAAMIGAVLGWRLTFLTLLLAALAGTLWGLVLILRKKGDRQTPLPFGTLLASSAMATLLLGPAILRAYSRLFGG